MKNNPTFWLDDEKQEIHTSKKHHNQQTAYATQHKLDIPKAVTEVATDISHEKKTPSSPNLHRKQAIDVHLNLTLPNLSKMKRKFHGKKKLLLALGACVVIFVSSVGLYRKSQKTLVADNPSTKGAQTVANGEMFNPLLPKDAFKKGIKTKYESERNAISFVDNWGGASFTISEQKLDTDTPLEKIAETAPGTKETVDTGMGKTIIATDIEKQQQTVIFNHKDILVFIRTPKILDKDEWILYIATLENTK